MIEFKTRSKEELSDMALVKKGNYKFKIQDVKCRRSAAGNDYLNVHFIIWDHNSSCEKGIFDKLMLIDSPRHLAKLMNFCKSIGIVNEYDSGKFNFQAWNGKTGILKLDIDPGNAEYPTPKNVVTDFILVEKKENQDPFNDDIPF